MTRNLSKVEIHELAKLLPFALIENLLQVLEIHSETFCIQIISKFDLLIQ